MKQIYGTLQNKTIIYIGDHEGDVEFARNIEVALCENSKVISIAAMYSGANSKLWNYKPDYEIENPTELLEIINN